MMDLEAKRSKEKKTVEYMIRLYCRKNHHRKELCDECRELLDYAVTRIDRCPFMENKTFCSNCRVHCYKPQMREKIRTVMRYSGPRMIFSHPVLAIMHLASTMAEKRRLENTADGRE